MNIAVCEHKLKIYVNISHNNIMSFGEFMTANGLIIIIFVL